MNRPRSPRLLTAAALAGTLAVVLAPGCGKPPPPATTGARKDVATDPWEAVEKRLRKDADLASCKAALNELNTDLANHTDVAGPPALSPEAEQAITALVPLAPEEVAELRPAAYSSLDPAYLADCLYLRDAARVLDPAGLPPADAAGIGFAWVCRQVYLDPWLIEVQPGVFQASALPPTYVLRRGFGSGLERAYVFLALLQQLGLDGCLIGPPDAINKPAGFIQKGPDGKPLTGTPKGPFWAVGVRVGGDVLLFEPWRGEPFPGPDGKGVGTLAQLKANPAQIKPWLDDAANPMGVTADGVKGAVVYLAVPVSSLSPRMTTLDDRVKLEPDVKLALAPAGLRDRFTAAAPNGPGLPADAVKFWHPPGDRFAYGRAAATFLPPEEGGTDRTDPSLRLYNRYYQALVPASLQDIPSGLKREPAERLGLLIRGNYLQAFFTPPTPREHIQRGHFQDAARDLTDKQQTFGRGLERLRAEAPGEVDKFRTDANEVYDTLRSAQYPDPLQRQPRPDSDPAVAEARLQVDAFWKAYAPTVQLIVDRATAAVGRAEASYLLALTKHEEAERDQLRAGRASVAGAPRAKATASASWAEAANAWAAYLEQVGSPSGAPARTAHARQLAARAKAMAAAK